MAWLLLFLLPILGLCDQPIVPGAPALAENSCKPAATFPTCPRPVVQDKIVASYEWFIKNVTTGSNKIVSVDEVYNFCCKACTDNNQCKAVNIIFQPIIGTDRACQPTQSFYYATCMLFKKNKGAVTVPITAIGVSNGYAFLPISERSPPPPPSQPPPPPQCKPGPSIDCVSPTTPGQRVVGRVIASKVSDVKLTREAQAISYCCSYCRSFRSCIFFNLEYVSVGTDPTCIGLTDVLVVNCTLLSTFQRTLPNPSIYKYRNVYGSYDRGLEPDGPSPPPPPPPCRTPTTYPACGASFQIGVTLQVPPGTVLSTVTSLTETITTADDGYSFCCSLCFQTSECNAFNAIWQSSATDPNCSPPRPVFLITCELIKTDTLQVVDSTSVIEFQNGYGRYFNP